MKFPDIVAHADWSANHGKRWITVARLGTQNQYLINPPYKVGEPQGLIGDLRAKAGSHGTVLLGFDFPIGLPISYARAVEVEDFLSLLPKLGSGEWADFYKPATSRKDIHLHRPFYPHRPGGTRQKHLLDALGMEDINHLLRCCELPTAQRRAAAPLFWTLGGQQVGKASISGWRDVLAPELRDREGVMAIWPFSGSLAELLESRPVVVVETYPGEAYHHIGVSFSTRRAGIPLTKTRSRRGKRSQEHRAENSATLLDWARKMEVRLDRELREQILDGFGGQAIGEDTFDATVGLFGMLNVIFGARPSGEPFDEARKRVEGWILGQVKENPV